MQVSGKIRVEEGKDGDTRLVGTLTVTGKSEDNRMEYTCPTCGYEVRLYAHFTGQANCPICGHQLVPGYSSYEPTLTLYPYPSAPWQPSHRESVTAQYRPNTIWQPGSTAAEGQ